MTIVNHRTDADHARVSAATDTMPQCVFRERLEDEIWNQGFRCCGIDVKFDLEAIGKPHFLNTQVQLDEVDLLPQFNFLPRRMIERVTKEIAQSDQHSDCGVVLVVTNKTHDAVQRVEEKVRMQLHTQCVQLRLGEL